MNKTVIRWKPVAQVDPTDRSRTIYVPTIVERSQTKTLTDVVYSAIDRGLIAGLKTSAAQAIAEGILSQLGQELNSAHGVLFGDFFAVRAYLDGTVDGLLGSLTADNKLNTRFVAGSSLRLDRKDFSFRNVLETGDAPYVDQVQAAKDGAVSGTIVAQMSIQFIGSNLKMVNADTIQYFKVADDGTETNIGRADVSDLTQNSDSVVTISSAPDSMAAGSRYAFKFVKTVTLEGGKTATVESNKVYAQCIAA